MSRDGSVPTLLTCHSFVKSIELLWQQTFLDGHLGLVDLKEKRPTGVVSGGHSLINVTCWRFTHLEGFADADDAPESAAVVAENTVSSLHRDFLFTNINLQKQLHQCHMGLV